MHKQKVKITGAVLSQMQVTPAWVSAFFTILFSFFIIKIMPAQINTPTAPKFETFKPVTINQSYTNSNPAQQNQPAGMNYTPAVSSAYYGFSSKQRQELESILNEAGTNETGKRFGSEYYKTPAFAAKTKSFTGALQYLKDMLAGKHKLSVADAYFVLENAYGGTYLTKKEYDKILDDGADFIKKWMQQNGFNINDNEAKNMALQKLMSDTLTITIASPDGIKAKQTITHYPYFYDYEDFKGEKDYRNFFTTKCLATGSGQCNSLPAVYAGYAEKLNAKCYLAFAPLHSFIKYPAKNGKIHSYEPTSNWNISDKWYEDNLFISAKAKASGIYLDTLNKKQIIANCMNDLAFGYMQKFGAADGVFIKDCVATAMQYFPKKNNIEAYFIYSSLLARQLYQVMDENKITNLRDIQKVPAAVKLYNALLQNEEAIKNMGYQELPEQLYDELMQQHEFKGRKQAAKNKDGKQKRDLFVKSF